MSESGNEPWQHLSEEEKDRIQADKRCTSKLAKRLKEGQPQPYGTLRRIVQHWGREYAERMCEQAERLHAEGKMFTPEGKPRTLGGVMFFIVKQDKKGDPALDQVFPNWKKRREKAALAKQLAKPQADPQHPVS